MTVAVQQAGVDTWSPCWKVDPGSNAARLLDMMATQKSARGALLPDAIGGHRVGWIAGVGMLYAEGHPAPDGLCPPRVLPAAYADLVASMRAAGVPVPEGVTSFSPDEGLVTGVMLDGEAGVRRLDATVDLRFEKPAEGAAVLTGVAALLRNAGHAQIRADRLGVQTVYLHGRDGKKVLGRWYDKGLESGSAPRGTLIRPEDQRRYVKGTRREVHELTASYVRAQFHRRFMPLYKASKGVVVAGEVVIADKLMDLVEAQELTHAEAERLAGYLLLEKAAERRRQKSVPSRPAPWTQDGSQNVAPELPAGQSRATSWRRRSKLAEHGLVLADDVGATEPVEVDLHEVMEAALDAPGWGAQG